MKHKVSPFLSFKDSSAPPPPAMFTLYILQDLKSISIA